MTGTQANIIVFQPKVKRPLQSQADGGAAVVQRQRDFRSRQSIAAKKSGISTSGGLRKVGIEIPRPWGFFTYMTVVIAKPSERQVKKEVKAMRQVAKEIATTPARARSFLIEKGFITKANKLSRRYG